MSAVGYFSVQGVAQGECMVLTSPLSFWGGADPNTGRIIDRSQPKYGETLANKVLIMPSGRGSSSSSSVLAELIRQRTGPCAIIMRRPDPIVTAGSMVALSLYGIVCPVVICDDAVFTDGQSVTIRRGVDGEALVDV